MPSKQPPFTMIAILLGLFLAATAPAADGFLKYDPPSVTPVSAPAEVVAEVAPVKPAVAQRASPAGCENCQCDLLAAKLDLLTAEVDKLKRTQLTEPDVRRIAEDVFRKLSFTVQQSDGKQRAQVVQATTNASGFQLAPGETLVGYTDPDTGQFVDLRGSQQSGVTNFQGEGVQVQQRGTRATVRLLPRLSRPAMQSSGTCRMVNGQRVCN